MSKDNTQGDYEVGYRKPPKNTQFQRGISGNPKGRPRKSLSFNNELIREARSFVTISENGRKKRISKHQVVVKQVLKQAMTGNVQATRTYFGLYQQAFEKIPSSAPQQFIDSWKEDDPRNLTDEQLMMIVHDGVENQKRECGKEHLSNAEFIESRRSVKVLSSPKPEE